jgi:hypothetical protein
MPATTCQPWITTKRADRVDAGADGGLRLALGLFAGGLLDFLAAFLGLDLVVDRLLQRHQFGGQRLGLGIDQPRALQGGSLQLDALRLQRHAQAADLGAVLLGDVQALRGGHVIGDVWQGGRAVRPARRRSGCTRQE